MRKTASPASPKGPYSNGRGSIRYDISVRGTIPDDLVEKISKAHAQALEHNYQIQRACLEPKAKYLSELGSRADSTTS